MCDSVLNQHAGRRGQHQATWTGETRDYRRFLNPGNSLAAQPGAKAELGRRRQRKRAQRHGVKNRRKAMVSVGKNR